MLTSLSVDEILLPIGSNIYELVYYFQKLAIYNIYNPTSLNNDIISSQHQTCFIHAFVDIFSWWDITTKVYELDY